MRLMAGSQNFGAASGISRQSFDSLLALGLIVSSILWFKRYQKQDPTALQDAYIFVLSELWVIYTGVTYDRERTVLCVHVVVVVIGLVVFRIRKSHQANELRSQVKISDVAEWAKPLIFPGRTTHSRFIPRKHSFSYSYVLVGIPIGLRGKINAFFSVDTSTKCSLFSVDAVDYLDRDSLGLSLRSKLDLYLRRQGVEPHDYPYAYLVTAPRVFGYSFNPASFWYLYNTENALGAMIVEVNNTFDERRVYFLSSTEATDAPSPRPFASKWKKDFHVSPFNSLEGMYTILAEDPVLSGRTKDQVISNTITLLSPEGQPKIVARLFSTGPPIDPAALGTFGVLKLLFRFGWIGFLTFPRILAEARKLYFWRNLPVWYRPEVRQRSIGRRPTSTERSLASFFSHYLRHVVEQSETPISVIYQPAPDTDGGRLQIFTTKLSRHDQTPVVEVQILSPGFYSRFVHYAHASDAFDNECFSTAEENRTIQVSQPDLFAALFHDKNLTSSSLGDFRLSMLGGKADQLRWKAVRILRCPPGKQSYSPTTKITQPGKQETRYFPYSSLDLFVMQHCSDAWLYRRAVSGLFIAQRLAFGVEPMIALLDKLLRFTVTSTGFCMVLGAMSGGNPSLWLSWGLAFLLLIFQLSIIHIWSLVKGL